MNYHPKLDAPWNTWKINFKFIWCYENFRLSRAQSKEFEIPFLAVNHNATSGAVLPIQYLAYAHDTQVYNLVFGIQA